jgi:hypothetical protein
VKPSREYLGLAHVYFVRRKVFLLVDALETDEYQSIRIERTRVYFDDVLALTYHRERGILFPLFCAFNTIAWGVPAVAILLEGRSGATGPGVFVFLIAGFFFLAFLLRMILQMDVITVMGRRTNTVMKFWFRKGRAQEVYTRLIDQIRARQEKVAASLPPPAAPPEPPGPPPPAAAAPPLPPEPPPVPM